MWLHVYKLQVASFVLDWTGILHAFFSIFWQPVAWP